MSCVQNDLAEQSIPINSKDSTSEAKTYKHTEKKRDSLIYSVKMNQTLPDSVILNPTEPKPNEKWNEVLKSLQSKIQTFSIIPSEDNLIEGKEGTQILIPSNTFDKEKEITITLKESYSKSSYIFDCLSTQTDSGKLLETAGMVELRAYSKGNEIQLPKNKRVTIKFPVKGEKKGDFNLFNQSIRKDSIVEWKLYPNGRDGICLFEIDLKAGFDHIYLKGNRKEIDLLTQKERDLLARRLQNSVSQRFPLVVLSSEDNRINFSRQFYENDNAFFELLSKIGNHLDSLGFDLKNKFTPGLTINFTFGNPNSKIDIEKYNKIVSERDRVSKAERKQRLIKAISYYSLASESLGWINCDRFINNPNKRINMNIIAKSKNEKFMFYLKEFNGALQSSQKHRKHQIKNIPKGILGVIIALKYENQNIYIARKKVKASLKNIEDFQYELVALKNLEEKINKMAEF